MKKLLLLAAAALLLLPVHAQAYSISYVIDSVAPGLDYTASITGGTLSFTAKTIGANADARISGSYMITADPGEDADLTAEYTDALLAQWDGGDMTTVRLGVYRPGDWYSGIMADDADGNSTHRSHPVSLQTDTAYTFYGLFSNETTGYAEASFSMTVPQSATPIPGAVWLLGSGLVGLVGVRRRMKNGDA